MCRVFLNCHLYSFTSYMFLMFFCFKLNAYDTVSAVLNLM